MAQEDVPKVPENAGKSWHSVIKRPNNLKKKIPARGGIDPEKAFAQADKIIKNMSSEYLNKLGEDVILLEKLGAAYIKDRSEQSLESLFRLVHNMRGQGATFGYPLITEIGRSFCRYVKELDESKQVKPALIDQHVAAMRVVYKQSIQGAGDQVSKQVVAALNEVVSGELT